jgi:hypothetical protein
VTSGNVTSGQACAMVRSSTNKNWAVPIYYYYLIVYCGFFIIPPLQRRGVYCFTSVRLCPKIFFVAFFSATIDGRNLIFGHKLHIGTPYRRKRFLTRQIPTSCLPTLLIFIHI